MLKLEHPISIFFAKFFSWLIKIIKNEPKLIALPCLKFLLVAAAKANVAAHGLWYVAWVATNVRYEQATSRLRHGLRGSIRPAAVPSSRPVAGHGNAATDDATAADAVACSPDVECARPANPADLPVLPGHSGDEQHVDDAGPQSAPAAFSVSAAAVHQSYGACVVPTDATRGARNASRRARKGQQG